MHLFSRSSCVTKLAQCELLTFSLEESADDAKLSIWRALNRRAEADAH